jgi:hypothetical protein
METSETHTYVMFYAEADYGCPHPKPDYCFLPLEECPHDGYCPVDEWYDMGHVGSTDGECYICLETPIGLMCEECTYEFWDTPADKCRLLINPCGHMYCDEDQCELEIEDE